MSPNLTNTAVVNDAFKSNTVHACLHDLACSANNNYESIFARSVLIPVKERINRVMYTDIVIGDWYRAFRGHARLRPVSRERHGLTNTRYV